MLLLLTACVHAPPAPHIRARAPDPAPSVLIHDVRVFSATDAGVEEHVDVRIADGLITDVVATGSGLSADTTVDGHDRTLLPGLVDLHVHLALTAGPPWYLALPDPPHTAQSMVYAGVTTVLDLGGDPKVLRGLKRAIATHRWLGPRILYAGQGLTVAAAYPLDMVQELYGPLAFSSINGHHFRAVTDVADIEAQVDRLADEGASFIKLMAASIPPADPATPRLSEEMIVAATRRAHEHGLKVAAHIDSASDALICARAGVDLLAHGVETSALTDADLATLKASGIAFEPTLVNWNRWDELTVDDFQPNAMERATQPAALLDSLNGDQIRAHLALFQDSTFRAWGDALSAHKADRVANTAKMVAAGIPLRVGSDSEGSIATFPGAIHEELRLLVEAGVPAKDVLYAATRGNALFLDADAKFGAVAPGMAADLLLVDGDPTVDVRKTEAIVQVWVGGVGVRQR
jgi:imidazolonepropionase-like amidohydrolase